MITPLYGRLGPLTLARRRRAAFTPLSVSPSLWLKADAGVYTDAGKTSPASNGQPVYTWADQSGNGNDATQSASGDRPSLATGSVNGLPALAFNGTTHWLRLTSPITLTDHSLFAVISCKTGGGGDQVIFGSASAAYYQADVNPTQVFYYDGNSSFVNLTLPGAGWHSVESGRVGTAWRLFQDGVQFSAALAVSGGPVDFGNISGRQGGSLLMYADLAEVVAFSRYLSDDDRAAIAAYFRARYGTP